jgi:predicted dehydrogenase
MNAPARPRLGLIGISGYAKIYLQLLREARERVDLVAAVVINPEEEAADVADLKRHGTTIYSNYEEMLAKEAGRLDLCLIPTGISWHARMTVAALRAGANVLVEKPLTGSIADAEAISAAERATGKFVAVGFQDIYAPEVMWLKDQICGGAIGKLKSVRMIGLWPRPAHYFTRNHWAGRLRADGAAVLDSPLNNAFGHFVNLGLFFAGAQPRASAHVRVDSAELYRANAIETFDTAVVHASSPEGVKFWFGVSHTCRETREPELYLEGTEGRIEWWHEQRCVLAPKGGATQVRTVPDTTGTRRAMFEAVLSRLTDPSFPICDTSMAQRHTALIEAVHQAAPIHTLPSSLIEWENNTGPIWPGNVPVVRGLEEALERALETHGSLSKNGFAATAPSPS